MKPRKPPATLVDVRPGDIVFVTGPRPRLRQQHETWKERVLSVGRLYVVTDGGRYPDRDISSRRYVKATGYSADINWFAWTRASYKVELRRRSARRELADMLGVWIRFTGKMEGKEERVLAALRMVAEEPLKEHDS